GPDDGFVTRVPASATVGYLPQEPDSRPAETVRGYLARRTGVADAAAELDALTLALEHDPSLVDRYTAALERFVALGGADLDHRVNAASDEVGLADGRLDARMDGLSGGEAARATLAALLLARFDVFLLDEPTNNLDFDGLERLERFLDTTPAGVVLVSHDRALLDRSVHRIVELDEHTRRARGWAGGWSAYEAARERARAHEQAAYAQYAEERSRIEEQQRRMQRWEQAGYGQGRKKKKSKDVAKAFDRKLSRLDASEKPWEPWRLQLALSPQERSGDVVARLEGAVVERGAFRLGPIDVDVRWGERLAVLGSNGSGKTTLLAALLGKVDLLAGRRFLGPGVVLGEVEQRRELFADGRVTLLERFGQAAELRTTDARTLLAKFGLGAGDVVRAASSLSPGERTRAVLALLMARGANCLVLDEPTNHLDLPAIEQLESALAAFEGTLVLVSHDRRLLETVEPTRAIDLDRARAARDSGRAWLY
ncbi:MAG: ATP-binding cassette domain-containing protein, partial [Actinomycetota bacterium]|nr:ATP-binding cassette domain-containing protein [Actinomycetota bacterium]